MDDLRNQFELYCNLHQNRDKTSPPENATKSKTIHMKNGAYELNIIKTYLGAKSNGDLPQLLICRRESLTMVSTTEWAKMLWKVHDVTANWVWITAYWETIFWSKKHQLAHEGYRVTPKCNPKTSNCHRKSTTTIRLLGSTRPPKGFYGHKGIRCAGAKLQLIGRKASTSAQAYSPSYQRIKEP